MRLAFAFCLALAGCCDPAETVPADAGADASCLCDCSDGPPPAGQISTYCLDAEHDGQPCCLGPDVVGHCKDLECAQ